MSRKKHLLERHKKLSECYAQCFKEYMNPYHISKNVKGYAHSSYSEVLKDNTDYFYTRYITKTNSTEYKSKIGLLISLIDHRIGLTDKEKTKLKTLLDSKSFRFCISKDTSIINTQDILIFISNIVLMNMCTVGYRKYLIESGRKPLKKTDLRKRLKQLDNKFLPEIEVRIKADEEQFKQKDKAIPKFFNLSESLTMKLRLLNPEWYKSFDLVKYSMLYVEAHNY